MAKRQAKKAAPRPEAVEPPLGATMKRVVESRTALKAAPDLDELSARGIIRRVGSRWQILQHALMPSDAWSHVTSIEQRTRGTTQTTFVTFRRRRSQNPRNP